MTTEDVLLEDLCIEGLAFWVISREALFRVRDEDSAITSTLESTEDTGSS